MAKSVLCSIENCGKRAAKRGWCSGHYKRWRAYGDPLQGRSTRWGERAVYLRQVVLPYDGDECLLWPYSSAAGYGIVTLNGRECRVNRIVCEAEHGPAPSPQYEAAHSCGNGHLGCCAKRHLRWATSKENTADSIAAGTLAKGSRHGMAKLTEQDVRSIRNLFGRMLQKDIAAKFNVSRCAITDIKKGRYWSWLT